MHGNVWEWVEDCWNGSYSRGRRRDGVRVGVRGTAPERVLRGGSWRLQWPGLLRAAYRDGLTTGGRTQPRHRFPGGPDAHPLNLYILTSWGFQGGLAPLVGCWDTVIERLLTLGWPGFQNVSCPDRDGLPSRGRLFLTHCQWRKWKMTPPDRQHPQQRVAGATWLAPARAAVLALVSLPVGAAIVDLTKEAAETMRVMPSPRPVALVVGNTGYEHIAPDRSGKNDAEAVAQLLADLGFEVVEGVDLDRAEFVDRVADFHERSRGRMAALFYYSGHAYRGSSFAKAREYDVLVPVDMPQAFDVGGIALDDIRAGMEGDVNLLFLDASLPAHPRIARLNTFIAYAGGLAKTVVHEGEVTGAFTKALLTTIAPGVDVVDAVQAAIQSVSSVGDQHPWMESSLRQPFRFPSPTSSMADRLDARLVALIVQFEAGGQEAVAAYGAANSVDVKDGRVAVRIIAESEDHVEPLKRLIETAAHGSVQATFENNIYASLPVEVIATFARAETVYRIDLGEAVVAPPEQDSVPVPAGEGPAASQAIPEHSESTTGKEIRD